MLSDSRVVPPDALLTDPDWDVAEIARAWDARFIAAARAAWWNRIVQATDPAERIRCQRAIDRLGVAIGLTGWSFMALANQAEAAGRLTFRAEEADRHVLQRWGASCVTD